MIRSRLASIAFAGLALIASTATAQTNASAPTAPPTPIAAGFGQGAYRPGSGITNPTVVLNVQPKYTHDAMQAKMQGDVTVDVVIQTDGTVGDVRVAKSLDQNFGLDDAAIAAAKKWQFKPALLNGTAVPMVVSIEMSFRLTKAPYSVSTPGLIAPVPTKMTDPKYTSDAMRQKIQGDVTVNAVVNADGTVGDVEVTTSLDPTYGLDDEAIKAVKLWKFTPGTLNGVAVAVSVELKVNFRLH